MTDELVGTAGAPHHARHHEHARAHEGAHAGAAEHVHLPGPSHGVHSEAHTGMHAGASQAAAADPAPRRRSPWQRVALVAAGTGCIVLGAGLALLVHPGFIQSGGGVAAAAGPRLEGAAGVAAVAAPPSTAATTDPRGTTPAGASPRYPADTPVLLFGDSLAVGIAAPLAADWPHRELIVDAVEGRSTTTAAGLLAAQISGMPPVWVVSLGTNDAPEDFPAAATSIMQQAGPDRCVVWYDVRRAATDAAINPELAVLLEEYPNLHLIDWHDLADAHPEWFSVDDIHPSAVGYELRARQAVQAVAEQCTSTG